MEFILGLAVGLAAGAIGMFFVYKNNKNQFKAAAEKVDAKEAELRAKFDRD
jgi:hypothetical protein